MLKAILKTKNYSFWIWMHVLLGIASSVSSIFFAIWFFAFVISSISYLSKGNSFDRPINFLFLVSYLSSLELLVRMSKAWKYKIPWEFGKYVMLFGFLYGVIVLGQRRGVIGFLLLFLLLPSFFLGPETVVEYAKIVGNFFGPLALCVAIIYNWHLKITRHQLQILLKLILLPCVSVLSYTLIKNPDFSEYQFDLAANFATAGGYGSNQVSTVLGLGTFITFVFWLNNWELFKRKSTTLILFFLFGVQGLLTFSRGGMIGAIVGILTVAFIYFRTSYKGRQRFHIRSVSGYIIGSALAITIAFWVANEITGGMLELRYQGETGGTLRGTHEKSLNTLTSNRYDIFLGDLELWQEYFIFGTGVGGSPYLRGGLEGYQGKEVAAHVELSRLLAEHGIFGLFFFVILIYIGFKVASGSGNPKYTAMLLALYMLAVYTTFHAATRTFVTPLLVGLSVLRVVDINQVDETDLQNKKLKKATV